MDDVSAVRDSGRSRAALWLAVGVIALAGCSNYVGTTARSFIGHIRRNPDPNVRFQAYSKLASPSVFDNEEQKQEAASLLIERYEKGNEPIASRAMICRALGELRDPRGRDILVKATSSLEAVIKIEACRALGKAGRPEDATVLAQIMTIDTLEDARIAAVEGLSELKTNDLRIYQVLLDGMEHDDPAIRLASLNALRKLTGQEFGVEAAGWRKGLKPTLDSVAAANPGQTPQPAATQPVAGTPADPGAARTSIAPR